MQREGDLGCLTRQGALFKTKWREGELLNLAKGPCLRLKGEKASCANSPRRHNKTRRYVGELYELAKAPFFRREGEKASC